MKEKMTAAAKTIIETLEFAGYQAYFVGGYVRDTLLGMPVKDIDIATSALPEEVNRLFSHTIPTGLQHGTVTIVVDGHAFEVTTFRKESQYVHARRPAQVEFIDDLAQDLARRDFTINAMAMDGAGRVIDPFGGQVDLQRGVLRCVGDPAERFGEDALRMLRCVRFAAAYGLAVDAAAWAALRRGGAALGQIAMERVHGEWDRIVAGPDPGRGTQLLLDSELLCHVKVPLGIAAERWSALRRHAVPQRLGALADVSLRWAALWLALGLSAADAAAVMRKLTFPRRRVERIRSVLEVQAALDKLCGESVAVAEAEHRWKRIVLALGKQPMLDWLSVSQITLETAAACIQLTTPAASGSCALPKASEATISPPKSVKPNQPISLEDLRRLAPIWLAEMPICDVAELAVSGREVLAATDKAPGPWLGHVLSQLVEDVALQRVTNVRDVLLERAKEHVR